MNRGRSAFQHISEMLPETRGSHDWVDWTIGQISFAEALWRRSLTHPPCFVCRRNRLQL
jgi:hypothetical protein